MAVMYRLITLNSTELLYHNTSVWRCDVSLFS